MVGGAPNEIACWEKILTDFTQETGIKIDLIRQTTDSDQRKQGILLALRGKVSDPDVMLLDVGWIGQIAASEWLEPLDSFGINGTVFFPSVIRLADTHKGRLIGLPLYVDGGLLYFRKDLLEKYGFASPPTSWDNLRDCARAIQDKERKSNLNFWGFVWQGAQYEGLVCNALEYFVSAGGGFIDEKGIPVFDSEANLKALSFMKDLIQTDKISPPNTFTDMKEEEVRQVFHQGNALFERNWPYAWSLHQAEGSPVRGKVGLTSLPGFGKHPGASTLGGWHIVVSRFSDRKKDAVAFVKFVTSAPLQKKIAQALGWNPGRMDVYDDATVLLQNPALSVLKQAFLRAVPRPGLPCYSEMSLILQKHFNAALSGNVSPQAALQRTQGEVKGVLKEYEP
ncbi:MAG: ABC transporter substrate-binding protein [Candidatus Ozemobacteraceae bacterium]